MSLVLESRVAPPLSPGVSRRPPALLRQPVLVGAGTLQVQVAGTPQDIDRALELRHRIFIQEMGAGMASGAAGQDRDIFDAHCQHLIVRDTQSDEVVGTYRVLMPEQARALGCLYTDREFWLTRLNPIRSELVEIGRACVHPAYRSGLAIMLLWSGLGVLLAQTGHRYLIGCASVPMNDGGLLAANLYRQIAASQVADESLRVWPRDRLPIEAYAQTGEVSAPPLMKGYLRAGARLLGEPHLDAEFGCADFPLLMPLDQLTARYRRRFAERS